MKNFDLSNDLISSVYLISQNFSVRPAEILDIYDELNAFQKIELDLYILNSAVGLSKKNNQHSDENILDEIKEEIITNGRIRNND